MVGQVDNFTPPLALDRGVRRIDKASQVLRQPMIAPRLPTLAVHPLLHDDPMPIVGDDEAVQIQGEPVLHGGTVDLRHKPAGRGKHGAVEAHSFADRHQFLRGPA
jgi:hypothetical protein